MEYGRDVRVEFKKSTGKVILFCRELEIYFYQNVLFKLKGVGVFFNHTIEDFKQGKSHNIQIDVNENALD